MSNKGMRTEGESRGSLCFVRTANFCIGNFHDSNAKTLGSNKVRHAGDGCHVTLPCGFKTRRLSTAITRENTMNCRPCHVRDGFDINHYCLNCRFRSLHSTLALVSDSDLQQVSLEFPRFQSIGMSHAVFGCRYLAWVFSHNLTLHRLKHLIVLLEWRRCLLSRRLISGSAHTASNNVNVYGYIFLEDSASLEISWRQCPWWVSGSLYGLAAWILEYLRLLLPSCICLATFAVFSQVISQEQSFKWAIFGIRSLCPSKIALVRD